jgi:DNA (cytosine-5)-methyltransferase 1
LRPITPKLGASTKRRKEVRHEALHRRICRRRRRIHRYRPAIGRHVDIAINHSPTAIAIHKANHPTTEHFCQDIRAVWPAAATRLRPVAGAWFSPDCKEYSKAKGGPVKDRHIRALSDEVEVWLKETQPRVAYLENVEEYETAGPLDEHGHEIKEMRGLPFKRRVARWRRLGYRVQHRKLRACDYGAPTMRRRLYVIMRRDGLPIVWPKPTHGHPDSPAVKSGKLLSGAPLPNASTGASAALRFSPASATWPRPPSAALPMG